MKKILLIVLILSLSLSCLLIAVEKEAFNLRSYKDSYIKYNIIDVTGKSYRQLVSITEDLFKYLKGKAGDEILEPNFNEREILHMQDVQLLFKEGFILKYLSIIISLSIIVYFALSGEGRLVASYIYKGLFVNWVILGMLILMILSDFSKYFTYFHEIFFNNDLWLLDPNTDLLIQMLPEEFFSSIAKSIVLSFLGFVATIQGIGYATVKKGRDKNEKKIKFFKREY